MLLHLPIAITLALPLSPVADSVPKFDMMRQCRSEGGSQAVIDKCVEDEKDALQQTQTLWTQSGAKDRTTCTQETAFDGTGSYVELLTCLEMTRDARNAGK